MTHDDHTSHSENKAYKIGSYGNINVVGLHADAVADEFDIKPRSIIGE